MEADAAKAAQHIWTFSPFDLVAGIVSATVATILFFIRRRNKRGSANGQWFADALTAGTLMVIGAIGICAVFGNVMGLAEVARANMLVVGLAFINSSMVLIRTMYDSCKPLKRRQPGRKAKPKQDIQQ